MFVKTVLHRRKCWGATMARNVEQLRKCADISTVCGNQYLKDGATLGSTKVDWSGGSDNLAFERLQLVVDVGAAKACTTRNNEPNERRTITARQTNVEGGVKTYGDSRISPIYLLPPTGWCQQTMLHQ